MTRSEWAEREVELACAKIKNDEVAVRSNRQALEALKMLKVNGESSLAFDALVRLYHHLPLFPITDEDFFSVKYGTEQFPAASEEYLKDAGLKDCRQCPRYSALFRDVDLEGNVTYHDIERAYCVNIHDSSDVFHGFLTKVVDEMFPIGMPYMPTGKRYKVFVEYFLSDPKNGYADHHRVVKVETPDGVVFPVEDYCWREVDGVTVRCTKAEFVRDYETYTDNILRNEL